MAARVHRRIGAHGHAAVDLSVTTRAGRTFERSLDIPPGFPGAELDDAQHQARFQDCLAYAPRPLPKLQVDRFRDALDRLVGLDDVRVLVPMLVQ